MSKTLNVLRLLNRIDRQVSDSSIVLLGTGTPSIATPNLAERVSLHSDTGIHCFRSVSVDAEKEVNSIDGAGTAVKPKAGGWFSDMVQAFAITRRCRIDVVVLGAYQVERSGRFVSFQETDSHTLGYGGAMDNAYGARKLIIAMRLQDGEHRKLIEHLDYPATADRPADVVITEHCVLRLHGGTLRIEEYDESFRQICQKLGLDWKLWTAGGEL